jgi:hypothetical protein
MMSFVIFLYLLLESNLLEVSTAKLILLYSFGFLLSTLEFSLEELIDFVKKKRSEMMIVNIFFN